MKLLAKKKKKKKAVEVSVLMDQFCCLPAPLERLQARLKYDFQMKKECDHAPSILSPSISTTLKNKN